MSKVIMIPGRFNGPTGRANGGVAAGLVADGITGPASVRLMAPIPLERSLELTSSEISATLSDGDGAALAVAYPRSPTATPPLPMTLPDVMALDVWPGVHPFPDCFVCGDRDDGLGLTPHVLGAGRIASACDPATTFGEDAFPEWLLWAALDCPSGFASFFDSGPAVLGTMTAAIHRQPVHGETLIVVAEARGGEGRKTTTASAVYNTEGALLANADAIWITVNIDASETG